MIETMIKRDGSQEPFQAQKALGWGQWSAKNLGDHVDWATAVTATISKMPSVCTTDDFQHSLIRYLLNKKTHAHQRMAGKLYASTMHKDLYGKGKYPTIQELHAKLLGVGYMVKLDYSDAEYAELNQVIDHEIDFNYTHTQLHQLRYKYALRSYETGEEFETPQFIFMRMAMALGNDQPRARRMGDVKAWYELFSGNVINAPTPNYTNLGTKLRGYASCCLYESGDTADSLAAGDHIAYKMTVMSAGIGSILNTRSKKDPVRGGMFLHRGKYFYLNSLRGAVEANVKNGRNGACTTTFSGFDPEFDLLVNLKNPMTPADKQNMGLDYSWLLNKFMGRKAAAKQDVFLFNTYTAPRLSEAFFSGDLENFEKIYNEYEADPKFVKHYTSARKILIDIDVQGFETGRMYFAFIDEINRHTSFKDPIKTSNLCQEVTQPVQHYQNTMDLYSEGPVGYIKFLDTNGMVQNFDAEFPVKLENGVWNCAQNLKKGDRFYTELGGDFEVELIEVAEVLEVKKEPEVALCSLAGLVVTNIKDDAHYAKAAYYALLMIDKCIHMSDYVLPHIGYTAKKRLSAGVGIMSLAHHMARKNLKYSSIEGKHEIHRVAETHAWHVINASLKLGQELGNAPWIHRTKWPEGWTPVDTYARGLDEAVPGLVNERDWPELSGRIKANGGIRHSSVICDMPGESSSKASGGTNSVYQIRKLALMKTDGSNATYWCAPDSDTMGHQYESAYETPMKDQIETYGILQKFTDMAISADEFKKLVGSAKVTSTEILENMFHRMLVGQKTRYYTNTLTAKAVKVMSDSITGEEEMTFDFTQRPEPLAEPNYYMEELFHGMDDDEIVIPPLDTTGLDYIRTDFIHDGVATQAPAPAVSALDVAALVARQAMEQASQGDGQQTVYEFADSADDQTVGCEGGSCSL